MTERSVSLALSLEVSPSDPGTWGPEGPFLKVPRLSSPRWSSGHPTRCPCSSRSPCPCQHPDPRLSAAPTTGGPWEQGQRTQATVPAGGGWGGPSTCLTKTLPVKPRKSAFTPCCFQVPARRPGCPEPRRAPGAGVSGTAPPGHAAGSGPQPRGPLGGSRSRNPWNAVPAPRRAPPVPVCTPPPARPPAWA